MKLTLENVLDVFYIAKKYMVNGLCEKVLTFVKENINDTNVFDLLAASEVYVEYEKT